MRFIALYIPVFLWKPYIPIILGLLSFFKQTSGRHPTLKVLFGSIPEGFYISPYLSLVKNRPEDASLSFTKRPLLHYTIHTV